MSHRNITPPSQWVACFHGRGCDARGKQQIHTSLCYWLQKQDRWSQLDALILSGDWRGTDVQKNPWKTVAITRFSTLTLRCFSCRYTHAAIISLIYSKVYVYTTTPYIVFIKTGNVVVCRTVREAIIHTLNEGAVWTSDARLFVFSAQPLSLRTITRFIVGLCSHLNV